MEITATNEQYSINNNHKELIETNPLFFDILVDLTGHELLPGIEVFKENRNGVFSARFRTHGYGIVITADTREEFEDEDGFLYAIAKPLFTDTNVDDTIELVEGTLNFDTAYILKDRLIELMIVK